MVILATWGISVFAQRTFIHPGGLHTVEDLDRMQEKGRAGESPWIEGWNLLIEDPKAQATYAPTPVQKMGATGREILQMLMLPI